MRRWGLVALCACNQVLGIDHTTHPLDAAIDAPFACPQVGVPTFQGSLHQLLYKTGYDCYEYTISFSAGRAVATCNDGTRISYYQGTFGGDLKEIPELSAGDSFYTSPRLAPEGDQLFVIVSVGDKYTRYRRQSDGSWLADPPFVPPPQIGSDYLAEVSTPSRGPQRHALALRFGAAGPTTLVELAIDDSPNLALVKEYTATALGIPSVDQGMPMLTPDGLHAVIASPPGAPTGVWYLARASIDQGFAMAQPLASVPPVPDPFLAEDCGQLYFSGIDSIWYAQQP